MAVRIRLRRMGANKKPFFRIVVADAKSANEGAFLEELGWYEPRKDKANYKIDAARAEQWIAKGAQPSETVASILRRERRAPAASATAPAAAAE